MHLGFPRGGNHFDDTLCGKACRHQRQMNLNHESALGTIHRRDSPAVEAHRALRNGESQTDPSGLPASSIVKPIEGLKKFFQRVGRNTVATISNSNYSLAAGTPVLPFEMNLNRRAFASVTDRIAHNVLNRAMQQRRISGNLPAPGRDFAAHVAVPGLRFELRILGHAEHHLIQQNRRGGHALFAIFHTRESKQTANQFVEASSFKFNSVEHNRTLCVGALPSQAQSNIQPGER